MPEPTLIFLGWSSAISLPPDWFGYALSRPMGPGESPPVVSPPDSVWVAIRNASVSPGSDSRFRHRVPLTVNTGFVDGHPCASVSFLSAVLYRFSLGNSGRRPVFLAQGRAFMMTSRLVCALFRRDARPSPQVGEAAWGCLRRNRLKRPERLEPIDWRCFGKTVTQGVGGRLAA